MSSKPGKRYRAAFEKVKGSPDYPLTEAIKLLKETATTKFDATAEVHFKLNIDSKKQEQNLRDTLSLPHGTGKSIRIAAVVADDRVKEAKEAGATAAGLEDLIDEFSKGKIDYDVIVAAPDVMKQLSKVAKILGQKGMMPNPKSGTVSSDIKKTIEELKRGRIEIRNDKEGNVHLVFGKCSFKEAELENNLKVILRAMRDSKPATVKGNYIQSITIASTMGPGLRLSIGEVMGNL